MSNDEFQHFQFWKELKTKRSKMALESRNLDIEMLVTDNEKPSYGVGRIDRVKDGLTYVWYDEIDSMIHYQEDELIFLTPISNG
jgi:hypothetical protein